MAVLAIGGMLWRQKRKANGLRREKKDWEEKYIALLQSQRETLRSENAAHNEDKMPMIHQLEDATIGELVG